MHFRMKEAEVRQDRFTSPRPRFINGWYHGQCTLSLAETQPRISLSQGHSSIHPCSKSPSLFLRYKFCTSTLISFLPTLLFLTPPHHRGPILPLPTSLFNNPSLLLSAVTVWISLSSYPSLLSPFLRPIYLLVRLMNWHIQRVFTQISFFRPVPLSAALRPSSLDPCHFIKQLVKFNWN